MSYLGITSKVTDNEIVQFIGDTALVIAGALVINSYVVQPGIEKTKEWWNKKDETTTKPAETGAAG